MLVIRGSVAFLKALGLVAAPEPAMLDTTTLGEWYAHVLTIERRRTILFVNAQSLLAVLVEGTPRNGLMDRFRTHLARLLFDIGVPKEEIDREVEATREVAYAKARDRSIMGTINRMGVEIPYYRVVWEAKTGAAEGLPELEDRFAREIWSATNYMRPEDVVRKCYGLTASDTDHLAPVQSGNIVVENLGDHDWEFSFPRVDGRVRERFFNIVESFSDDPLKAFHSMQVLVREFPEFIAAIEELARMSDTVDEVARSMKLLQHAVNLGTSALPSEFEPGRDFLRWGFLDNRPYLRALCFLGLHYDEMRNFGDAEPLYTRLLALNPDDNQGVRSLLVDLRLKHGDDAGALEICDEYDDSATVSLMYGRILALFRLGRSQEAAEALDQAYAHRPLVAREIARGTHLPPAGLDPYFITVNSEDEAWRYWESAGEAWVQTPKAIRMVADRVGRDELGAPRRPGKVVPFPTKKK